MTSPKKNLLDPEYELTEVAREHIKLKETEENQETLEKIIDIINREFKTELDHRQSQLDLIQQRLSKAQKTLHLLRYVLINAYYNEQNLYVSNDEESNADDHLISNKSRIHPTVKNVMLGLNTNDYKLNVHKSPRKKMKYVENTKINLSSDFSLNQVPEANDKRNEVSEDTKLIDNSMSSQKEECDMIRNRKKTKYRIVVGNISKWVPSQSEEDKSTHKWMVYVRGSKENPDISHFVEKVAFYLHPSYQPNDVIELRHPPFHLSRRGWGEFPLRVKIFFQYSLNKPVDIIHNLKLDKTFSGQQTLGNETIVNLFLYKNEKANRTHEIESSPAITIKEDLHDEEIYANSNFQLDVLENSKNEDKSYSEHDYCSINEEVKNNSHLQSYDFYKEHSYARINLNPSEPSKTDLEVTEQTQNSDLMLGINDSEQKDRDATEETIISEIKINDSKNIMPNSATVIAIKKVRRPQESLLKKCVNKSTSHTVNFTNSQLIVLHPLQSLNNTIISSSNIGLVPIDYKKHEINLPLNRFKGSVEALPYLFKRMPLITELASNLDYKCTYPYAAKSLDEYSKWNIGKRLSAEWFRAKRILKIVQDAKLKNSEKYTTKLIIMYARSHGYTPLTNYEIFKNSNFEQILISSKEEKEANTETSRKVLPVLVDLEDTVVDVLNCTSDDKKNTFLRKIKLVDQKTDIACLFIRQVVLDAGIILKPQEVIPGVIFNGAERMLLQALLCLAEDLIRKARMNLVFKGNFQEETSVIGVEDVQKALSQRPEFNFLMKFDVNAE